VGEEAVLTVAAREIRAIVGGALNIRQVDGGSCNGCEAEIGCADQSLLRSGAVRDSLRGVSQARGYAAGYRACNAQYGRGGEENVCGYAHSEAGGCGGRLRMQRRDLCESSEVAGALTR